MVTEVLFHACFGYNSWKINALKNLMEHNLSSFSNIMVSVFNHQAEGNIIKTCNVDPCRRLAGSFHRSCHRLSADEQSYKYDLSTGSLPVRLAI